jgi:hypothetical protein
MQISMFLSEELPANHSASQDSEKDWQTRVATSCWGSVRLLNAYAPSGWFGRTSPEFCHQTEDGILAPSSGCWANSGMGSHTEFLTLSTSDVVVLAPECSWSDILETGADLRRLYFSANALAGIERRLIRGYRSAPRLFSRASGLWLTTTERLAYWNQTGRVVRHRLSGNEH